MTPKFNSAFNSLQNESLGVKHLHPDGKRADRKIRAKRKILADIREAIYNIKQLSKGRNIEIKKAEDPDADFIRINKDNGFSINLGNRRDDTAKHRSGFRKNQYVDKLFTLAHEYGHSYQRHYNDDKNRIIDYTDMGHESGNYNLHIRLNKLAVKMQNSMPPTRDNWALRHVEGLLRIEKFVKHFHRELTAWEIGNDYIPDILDIEYVKSAYIPLMSYAKWFKDHDIPMELVREIEPTLFDKFKL